MVDTSVLSRLRHRAVRAVLEPRTAAGQIGRAGISDLEVGFSARDLAEWYRLTAARASFPLIETDASHVQRAREIHLASRGLRSRTIPDLLIAAAAEQSGLREGMTLGLHGRTPPTRFGE
jgi:predicted nucleic acid-binding protein